ncbi:MAG: hypothetical protein COU81_02015, partial [Candidatus Portnoybacteria bacterium CG10_big_fil_rev_8_21_14_0_10_36_7]
NILPRLIESAPDIEWYLFYNDRNELKKKYTWLNYPNVHLIHKRWPNRLFNLSSALLGWPKIDNLLGGVDKFFFPHFFVGEVSKNIKIIVTFHDISFKYYPQFFSIKHKIWQKFSRPQKKAIQASRLIVDSHSTMNDLVDLYNIKSEKVKVIYLGVDDKFRARMKTDKEIVQVRRKYNIPSKIILFFGTTEPRKNIVGVIKAFAEFRKLNPEYHLIIAGALGWKYKGVLKEIEKTKNVLMIGPVDNKDREFVYNCADLFVYPSFFEGFGLPPLEAMASGIPVITSNCSSLPEVVGNSAIMVDPFNISEISFVMKEIIKDKKLYKSLRVDGIKRAMEFSWDMCADKTLEVIKEA